MPPAPANIFFLLIPDKKETEAEIAEAAGLYRRDGRDWEEHKRVWHDAERAEEMEQDVWRQRE